MNQKRVGIIFIFCIVFLLSIFSIGLVSAEQTGAINALTSGIESAFDAIKPGLEFILGEKVTNGQQFFVRVLFLILIFAIVWAIVARIDFFNDRPWIMFIVAVIVSVLAIKFMGGAEWVDTILLPYSTIGIFFVSFLPLLLLFWFLEVMVTQRILRRIGWILAASIFVGLWITRYTPLNVASGASGLSPTIPAAIGASVFNPAWVYLIAAAACIIIMLMDNTIQNAILRVRYEKKIDLQKSKMRAEIMSARWELERKFRNDEISKDDYDKQNEALKEKEKKYGVKYD